MREVLFVFTKGKRAIAVLQPPAFLALSFALVPAGAGAL